MKTGETLSETIEVQRLKIIQLKKEVNKWAWKEASETDMGVYLWTPPYPEVVND